MGLTGQSKALSYKTNARDRQSTDRVDQGSYPAYAEVLETDLEIPQEVASSKSLDHTAGWCVAPQSTFPVHLLPLRIRKDHIQSSAVDEKCLNHGHPVDIPVQACASVKACVCFGPQEPGHSWRESIEDEMVREKADQNFVDVVRHGFETQLRSQRLTELDQHRRRWDRVTHGVECWR